VCHHEDEEKEEKKQYIGLYFYMVTLIYNSILSGNLLTGGDLSEI